MQLPHGHENTWNRIELRAEAITRGAHWATETDATDINPAEDREIAAAKELAQSWDTANWKGAKARLMQKYQLL